MTGQSGALPGQWVQIHQVLMAPGARAPNLPPDTAVKPLEMRLKGFLTGESEASIGAQVQIRTLAGRLVHGVLLAIEPRYEHDFGRPIPELMAVGEELARES